MVHVGLQCFPTGKLDLELVKTGWFSLQLVNCHYFCSIVLTTAALLSP